jgi:hypothetical protein
MSRRARKIPEQEDLLNRLAAAFKRVSEASTVPEKPQSFFDNVALLDRAVREAQGKNMESTLLAEAESLLLSLWRSDLYCRFTDAPKVRPDEYLCRNKPRRINPTLEDGRGARPGLVFGGGFEMNRQRH